MAHRPDGPPPWRDKLRASLQSLTDILAVAWRERRYVSRYLRSRDTHAALKLRNALGLRPETEDTVMVDEKLFDVTGEAKNPQAKVDVILPVFNAYDDLFALLQSLKSTFTFDHHLIIVNDASDDPRIGSLLDKFVRDTDHTRLVTHRENQGFPAAVATGFAARRKDAHVILLNSDCLPPPDWISRLIAPFHEFSDVATVTPLSNNAEILSIPGADIERAPDRDFVHALDGLAKRLAMRPVDLPTGIGFCMAINRSFLRRIGPFDTTFGRGYGEEVDWCQKARALGGRNLTANNLFVGHQGGSSFGQTEKRLRIQRATKIIDSRYPDYASDVQNWVAAKPLAAEIFALSLAWLALRSEKPVPIYLAHGMGGGAETALQQEIEVHLAAPIPGIIILRVGLEHPWQIEIKTQDFHQKVGVASIEMVSQLLAHVNDRCVIYSCGVGAKHPEDVPKILLDLTQETDRLEIRLHDFFPVSPSWNLLSENGWFEGIPKIETRDPMHRTRQISHADWRALWSHVMARADKITVFSGSSHALITQAYPMLNDKVEIVPHKATYLPKRLVPGGENIGVLGGINRAKGGAVLEGIAPFLTRQMIVIGELEGCFHLPRPHLVHGKYAQTEIANLATYYDIGAWIIPSICPETFSFASHEALATGLPVCGFKIGAQGEILSRAETGFIFRTSPKDFGAVAEEVNQLMAQLEIKSRAAS